MILCIQYVEMGKGHMEKDMSKIMRYSADPYIYIKVDLDKEEVIEAAYGFSSKSFAIAERTNKKKKKILDKALTSLNRTDVKKLKELTGNDEKLKEAFKRVFRRKLREIIIYQIKEDE